MFIKTLTVLLMFTILQCRAFDLTSLETRYLAPSDFNLPAGKGNVKFRAANYKFSVNVPLPIKPLGLVLINGFSYSKNKIILETTNKEYTEPFESISYSAMTIKKLNSDWNLVSRGGFSINYPTLNAISKNDLKWSFMVAAGYNINERLKLGFGGMYTRITGGELVLPTLTMTYETEKHKVNLIPPVIMSYDYKFSKNNSLGIFTKLVGNEFEIKHKELAETFTLKFSDLVSGLSYKQHLLKGIWLTVNSGIAFGYRNIDFMKGSDILEDSEIDPGFVAGIKLSYSPEFKRKKKDL